MHGIHKLKRKYKLHCIVVGCNKLSGSVRDWNSHHRIKHKTPLKCSSCTKVCQTPSSLKDHKAYHRNATYQCSTCNQKFVYKSSLQLHRYLHLKHKLFRCFAGNCKVAYKWRQDLHRHIQHQLQVVHRCRLCEYSSSEIHLVRKHQRIHKDEYKYYCTNYLRCPFKMKYWTSIDTHKYTCKYS